MSLQLLGQLGDGDKEISDQAVVGNLEDGCLGILVDGNNGLGVLHAGQVLDGARDTNGDVTISNAIDVSVRERQSKEGPGATTKTKLVNKRDPYSSGATIFPVWPI